MRTVTVEENGVLAAFEVYSFGKEADAPRVMITAGIHGDEVTGVYAAQLLIDHLKAHAFVKGEVRVIPAANRTAMRCMQRRSPFDGADLNRIFPGDAKGGISSRLAHAVWEETRNAELLVDLHCCSQHGLPYILALYGESEKAKALCSRITLPRCIQSQGSAGQLFVESTRRREQAACIIELPSGAGGGALNLPVAEECLAALLDLLRAAGMLAGPIEGRAPAFYGPLLDVDCPRAGLWLPAAQRGDALEKGRIIGRLDGAPVLSPAAGMAMSVRPASYVRAEDLWAITYVQPGASA